MGRPRCDLVFPVANKTTAKAGLGRPFVWLTIENSDYSGGMVVQQVGQCLLSTRLQLEPSIVCHRHDSVHTSHNTCTCSEDTGSLNNYLDRQENATP